jgi:hypothetical protein
MLSNHANKWLRSTFQTWPLGVAAIIMACLPITKANAAGSDFNIQVSPSPIVINLTPGQTQTATVNVRNFSNHTETLQPGLSGVQVDGTGQKVTLKSDVPANMSSWLHFAPLLLTVNPGTSVPLTITYNTPQDVGFSYAVGITLTSTQATKQTSTGTTIKPEVVVFCLININRADAKSELSIQSFSSDKSRYAFLPASFTVQIKNTGNVISQPSGNIFIQRSFNDRMPITTLPINSSGGYILPGMTRSFTTTWAAGFPTYVTDAEGKKHLDWNWKHADELRLGEYTAKAVVVYDNGHQDVPLTSSSNFWIIPWWLLALITITGIVLVMGLVGWGWLLFKGTKKVKGYAKHAHRKK